MFFILIVYQKIDGNHPISLILWMYFVILFHLLCSKSVNFNLHDFLVMLEDFLEVNKTCIDESQSVTF